MQPITVAIADTDGGRRTKFEQSLQGELGIRMLTNKTTTDGNALDERRRNPRANLTAVEEVVARTRRLNPRILLAYLNQCTDAGCAMLVSLRRECPETLVVLLTDESAHEDQVMLALAKGARGCVHLRADPAHFSKAAQMVDRGEAWVPRKMLGKIMDEVMQFCHASSTEATLDPAC
jgi:DNA-binding NarL/FixJ family response regulator